MRKQLYICVFCVFTIPLLCWGKPDSGIRKAAVAGQFYPADRQELINTVNGYLSKVTKQDVPGTPVAYLVPHAGYIYSGQTAAYAYKLIKGSSVSNVILIGNSHRYGLSKGAVFASGSFESPLGNVLINSSLAKKIISESSLFEENKTPHMPEHSLEVQLPFLQSTLKELMIVPILFGELSSAEREAAGEALAKAVKSLGLAGNTIIIASSDLSHYPSWANANMSDGSVLKAVESLDPRKLEKTSDEMMSSSVPGLECALCGLESTAVAMHAAKALGADGAKLLRYENSGDVSGDRSRVVGYGAAVFFKKGAANLKNKNNARREKKMNEFSISGKNQQELLKVARLSIENFLKTRKLSIYKTADPELLTPAAVFVTLTQKGSLRGCIGTTEPHAPLFEAVNQLSIAAATEDYRFSPLTLEELENTHIEISVLSPLTRVRGADEISEGVHGVVVRRGGKSGLFLPQVWEQIPSKESFLNELCWQKAGLDPASWKDPKTELYIFTVFAFEEAK